MLVGLHDMQELKLLYCLTASDLLRGLVPVASAVSSLKWKKQKIELISALSRSSPVPVLARRTAALPRLRELWELNVAAVSLQGTFMRSRSSYNLNPVPDIHLLVNHKETIVDAGRSWASKELFPLTNLMATASCNTEHNVRERQRGTAGQAICCCRFREGPARLCLGSLRT